LYFKGIDIVPEPWYRVYTTAHRHKKSAMNKKQKIISLKKAKKRKNKNLARLEGFEPPTRGLEVHPAKQKTTTQKKTVNWFIPAFHPVSGCFGLLW